MVATRNKPGLVGRIASYFGYTKQRQPARMSAQVQGFAGARNDRTLGEYQPGGLTSNVLHRQDSKLLRERARDLVDNNPMARAAVNAYIANVVRCGIMPKPLIEDTDQRKQWSNAWEHWCKREADITGAQHYYQMQALFLEEVIVGGGCLMRFHPYTSAKRRGRRLPFSIELIPEERFAEDGDFFGNGVGVGVTTDSGNRIVRGVETDAETGKAVAYWVKPAMPNDIYTPRSEKPIRLDAQHCVYAFNKTRVGMTRGFTLLAPVILWLWKLGYYTDNELMASAIRSCFAAVIKTDGDQDYTGLESSSGELTDMNGNLLEHLNPGIVARLQHGDDIVGVGPNTPPGDAQTWIKLIQRSIAVGMDLSYFGMMRDTADSNFAGFRAGLNEDRFRYERWQDFVIYKNAEPVWERFVESAVMELIEGFPLPSEFLGDKDEWLRTSYRVPGRPSVTPLDDARAAEIELAIGINTRDRLIGERGYDWEDDFDQLAKEKAKATDLDIDIAAEPDAALPQDQVSSENRK